MIEPTVGRIVWLHGARGVRHVPHGDVNKTIQPFGARIVYVWSPRLINVTYEDHNGQNLSLASVMLLQDDDLKPDGEPFCVWMPYQIGQAKKNE